MTRPLDPGTSRYFDPPVPRVLAHRGLATEAPENTLLAFLRALAVGATHIETDVHASSDGVAMISHDADLRRIAGRPERIDELPAAKLAALDLGERQGVPRLREALDAFPDAFFNIDIKSDAAVQPTVAAIRAARATHRVLVTSFSGRRTALAARELPGVATSASSLRVAGVVLGTALHQGWLVRAALGSAGALQVPERQYGIRIVSPALLDAVHRLSAEVHVWTVNDPGDMRRLLALGVDGLVTDRADLAVEVLAIRRSSST